MENKGTPLLEQSDVKMYEIGYGADPLAPAEVTMVALEQLLSDMLDFVRNGDMNQGYPCRVEFQVYKREDEGPIFEAVMYASDKKEGSWNTE